MCPREAAVYYCELCEKSHSLLKKGAECPTCGRRYCPESIENAKLHGRESCPFCNNCYFQDFIELQRAEREEKTYYSPQRHRISHSNFISEKSETLGKRDV